MSVILETVPLDSARRHGQNGIQAIQSLYCGLLVDAKHRGMLWRIHIQPNDVCCFAFEIGVVGQNVMIESMRL